MPSNDDDYNFSSTKQIDKRRNQLQEFIDAVLHPKEQPWFVSDEASIYDIFVGDETEIFKHCAQYYGVVLQDQHMSMPLWQVLDYLEAARIR